jgi:hypothetical protein
MMQNLYMFEDLMNMHASTRARIIIPSPSPLLQSTPQTLTNVTNSKRRRIAEAFLTLPNRRELPHYYEVTKMPIALDTIEDKLRNHKFPTLTSLEGDFKRMISNAKEYNEKGSTIYDDAERIRKVLSNFMTKNNPVYITTPGFVTVPTPLPVEEEASHDNAELPELEVEVGHQPFQSKRGPGRPPKNPHALRNSMTPTSESHYWDVGYSSLNFQQAQEKIMEDIINYQEDPKLAGPLPYKRMFTDSEPRDEIPAFGDFIDLPPRTLRDYYKVIPNPVSLRQIEKRVKGNRAKSDGTNVSDFKTWAAFEEEFSYIWKNAWHYNEDDSVISARARELQVR